MIEIAARHDVSPADIERIHLTRMYRYSSQEQGITYAPDTVLAALTHKVEIVMDEELNRKYPGGTAAMILRVHMKNGRTFEQFVRYPKGNPNNPMDADDVQQKFSRLAARTLPDSTTARLADLLGRLETLPDIGRLVDAVRLS